MPHIFKQNCKSCGEYYKGQGKIFCSRKCVPHVKFLQSKRFGGMKHTKETIIKKSLVQLGEKGSNWRGGINPISKGVRKCHRAIEWTRKCMERDNFECLDCKDRNGNGHTVVLNVHHIIPFTILLNENKIRSTEQALLCEELWDINNGRTLCVPCHKKTETFGVRACVKTNK